jgi:hypothetical protein
VNNQNGVKQMDVTVSFKSGAELFSWKNVKARELDSVVADIRELAAKDEAARKAFKHQGRINGAKKPKGTKK